MLIVFQNFTSSASFRIKPNSFKEILMKTVKLTSLNFQPEMFKNIFWRKTDYDNYPYFKTNTEFQRASS